MAPLEWTGVLSEPRRASQYWRELRGMSNSIGFLSREVVRLNREVKTAKEELEEMKKELEKFK